MDRSINEHQKDDLDNIEEVLSCCYMKTKDLYHKMEEEERLVGVKLPEKPRAPTSGKLMNSIIST
jgi:hypothetical protein